MSENESSEVVNSIEFMEPYAIGREHIANKSSRQTTLIGSDGAVEFKTNTRWYEFKLKEPTYCDSIVIRSNNENIKGTDVEWTDPYGQVRSTKISNKDSGNIRINIKTVISCFRLKPEKRYINKIVLNELKIVGYLEDDFEKVSAQALEIDNAKTALTNREEKLDKRTAELAELEERANEQVKLKNEELSNLYESVTAATTELKELNESIEESKSTLSEKIEKTESLTRELNSLKNTYNQTKLELDDTNTKLSEVRETLRKKERDADLIAYEVEDYIKQGNSDKQTYILLSFLPWILIAYICVNLFNGAINIANSASYNIVSIVISRLPYTFIALFIVYVAFRVSEIFISKIIEINNQKLRLSEIGIIAKDVSYAVAEGLDIEDDELFELRTRLKMDLLRHHLKKLDPETFEYNINSSLWDSFLRRPAIKKAEENEGDEE